MDGVRSTDVTMCDRITFYILLQYMTKTCTELNLCVINSLTKTMLNAAAVKKIRFYNSAVDI